VHVIRVPNSTEKYKQLAKFSADIHQLTGRRDRASTDRRIEVVIRQLGHKINDNLIFDIGCGDANFAKAFALSAKKVVGILPTEEECERVLPAAESTGVKIMQGRTDSISAAILRFGCPDLIFCNSVLHGVGFDASAVEASIAHFSNNQKRNGLLYVGEIPQTDKLVGRNYGLSFKKYIWWCISKGRYRSAMINLC
jgi:2-polyprenyl-3-methyl-5-hydroxy-6-metoxy-1,4-benzoquinol methylase